MLYNAGSEVYSQSICNELSQNHQVSIFTREENPFRPDFEIREEKETPNRTLFRANMPREKDGYVHAQLDRNFGELLNELQPDIAHIGHLNHLSTGLVKELKKRNIPIVFTLHDFWLMCPRGQFMQRNFAEPGELYKVCDGQEDRKCATTCYPMFFSGREQDREADEDYWTRWIAGRMDETRFIIDQVDHFIAPSRYLMDRFIQDFGLPKEKVEYLDYGFPLQYLTAPEGKASDTFGGGGELTFGYIGTHIPAKGINHLIEAFSKVKGKARLRIWGRPRTQSTKGLKVLVEQLVAENQVEWMGEYVNSNIADHVFRNCDGIVVASIWGENSPLVIHEAQACKVPVITADFGGMKEYVRHQENGLLFNHRNPDDLARQMQWAMDNPEAFLELGKRGYLYSDDGKIPRDWRALQNTSIHIPKNDQKKMKSEFWRLTIDTNPEDCNLACIMCEEHSPYSDFKEKLYERTGQKVRRMPREWLEPIFREAKAMGIREIIPSTMGEPLLYKDFDFILELYRKYDIKCNLTTNGTFPKRTVREWAEMIVPVTSDVKISWNGATAETSEKVMHKIDFPQAIDNVKEFIRVRDEIYQAGGNFCRVTFQLTFYAE